MKKMLSLLLGISLILCLGSIASAQTVGVDLHGIYGFAFSDDDAELEKGWGGGGSLTFCLGELVKLDLGGDYLRPALKDADDNYVQLIPVTGTIRVGPQIEPVYLYVGGGAGYSFNSLDFEGNIEDFFELEDCFTYHACAGFELSFTPDKEIGLRGEGRYVWMKPDIKEKATGAKDEWNMNHFQARAGLVFYF